MAQSKARRATAPQTRAVAPHGRAIALQGRALAVDEPMATTGSDPFERLRRLALNLWWTWNARGRRLLAGLDPLLWQACGRNPVETLQRLSPERREALHRDPAFLRELDACERELVRYLRTKHWFARSARGGDRRMLVAYFCSEYALDDCLPQYAGGLGVLAGDHLKSASDLGVPLVAVGLLYRCGYYKQELAADGATKAVYPNYDFARLPLIDTNTSVDVPLGRRSVKARVWRVRVGRVPLFLLDTDVRGNSARDRAITRALYGGDDDVRIRQQIVLGVGGVRALEALKIHPTAFHLNEGHAAFCQLQRLREVRPARAGLDDAIERIAATTVFTTHTPVPAGNQRFANPLVLKYLEPLAREMGLERERFLGLGREAPADRKEPFCMTVLALRLSRHCNGVAELHGQVSRTMWQRVYGASTPAQVPIGHVTNGIHAQTWLPLEIEPLYAKYLKPRWLGAGPDDDWWKNASRIPPAELWAMQGRLRARLVTYLRLRLKTQVERRFGAPDELAAAAEAFDERALTIGFARRFATYKRAPLIFHDAKRLATILNDAKRPVQIVFAGKAHPADLGGQAFAQAVYRMAHKPPFRGRVALLENYDMQMGRTLTSGCDVWLNNPIRPQEASGTSGMKPPLHGGINCSILDGWWPEAYRRDNGWAIGDGRVLKSQAAQDRYDAGCICDLLESRIVPLFYRRGSDGVPAGWVRMMLKSMATVCGQFNTHRMVGEYVAKYYLPAHHGEAGSPT